MTLVSEQFHNFWHEPSRGLILLRK